ncbi:MAG: hypothetical protein L6R19_27330 [Alphaproteobacteria bacterium]|nr:hypothetical protein [Alphaproteobacteria bacterium]
MRTRRFASLIAPALAAALLLAGAVPAAAQRTPPPAAEPEEALPPAREALPPGENLLLEPPAGWELGFSDRDDDQAQYQYLPRGQEIENWTELLTVQVFFALRNVPPRAVLERMRKGFEANCDGAAAEAPAERMIAGYPSARQLLLCGRNRAGGGPAGRQRGEIALILAVGGRDALYVVQRAWRGQPFGGPAPAAARALVPGWQQYLDRVRVCDTRDRAKPCAP